MLRGRSVSVRATANSADGQSSGLPIQLTSAYLSVPSIHGPAKPAGPANQSMPPAVIILLTPPRVNGSAIVTQP